jgi:hypothetical protein
VKAWLRVLTCVAGVALASVGCTSSTETANNTPESSPSTAASPSPSPSPSPSTAPSSEPSPSPSASGLAITSLPFHNGEVGIGYLAVTLVASGGTAPYTWAVSGGAFPPGLALSTDGVTTGTNTKSGQFSFTVKVTDSTGATATAPGGFFVFPALSVTQPCAQQCYVGTNCAKCGGFGSVSGGAGPYTYTVVGGGAPQGMAVKGLSLTGAFPSYQSGWNVTVQVEDVFTATRTVNASWFVYNVATLNQGAGCSDFNTGACSVQWTYSGGNPVADPVAVWAAVRCDCSNSGTLPPNFNAVAKGGTVTITAGPIACDASGWSGEVAITLIDKTACASTDQSNELFVPVDISNGC